MELTDRARDPRYCQESATGSTFSNGFMSATVYGVSHFYQYHSLVLVLLVPVLVATSFSSHNHGQQLLQKPAAEALDVVVELGGLFGCHFLALQGGRGAGREGGVF